MKKILGLFLKVLLAIVVLVFLASESIAFFSFIFPPEKWYLAYTGFGLTSLSFLGYMYLFLYDADTKLKKTVALVMMLVGLAGELLTAGFGMQVEAWNQAGYTMLESDIDFMVLAIQALMLFHGVALIAYWIGDSIAQAFKDDDGDGVPNFLDPDSKKGKKPEFRTFPATASLEQRIKELEAENAALKNPTKGGKNE